VQAKLTVSEQDDTLTRLQHLLEIVATQLKNLGVNDPPPGLNLPDAPSNPYSSTPSEIKVSVCTLHGILIFEEVFVGTSL